MFKVIRQNNRGFTLVETLVAISIFTMSVLTLLIILSQGISSVNYAKNKIIAEYLAQEGIEYMNNIRDTNVITASTASVGWNDFKAQINSCFTLDGCYLNDNDLFDGGASLTVKNLSYTPCTGNCPALLYDLGNSSNGKYNYSYGLTTTFVRKITTTQVSPDEIKVTSSVSWSQGSGTKTVTFSTNLFNWIE
ncbi:MAG: prepilin-type N-terminal cleavage/methylation domain-containing protein [Candidatus Paceibacterota bacterium]|jgi:type II secretion system protein I